LHLYHRDINLETHITDILNVVKWEELDDFVLVGHSYGGMIITGVADRIPEKVRR
jgi:pimeloyl-ACP methyl ester carboxylesterase